MAVTDTYWARGDSPSANNDALNVVGQNGPNGVPSVEIQFSSNNGLGGPEGDLSLDNANLGTIDNDTWVSVDGGVTWVTFTVQFSGILDTNPQLQDVNGQNLEGQRVIVIEVTGGERLFFFPDTYTVDQATIDALIAKEFGLDIDGQITDPETPLCFMKGTFILTDDAEVLVEDLSVGDLVKTKNGSFAEITWIGKRVISKKDLTARPNFLPVRISIGAFGENSPHSDLYVSQQHRMLLDDWRLEMLFDDTEALVAAKHLLNDTTISLVHDLDEVVYYHVMFASHQIIYSNGTESESFHPGQWALDSLDNDARDEILALFPQLADGATAYGPTARPALKGFEAKALSNFA